MCRKCFHVWQCCTSVGGVRVRYLLEVCLSAPLLLGRVHVFMFREGLVATCGSVLVELWVCGEAICLQAVWWKEVGDNQWGTPKAACPAMPAHTAFC